MLALFLEPFRMVKSLLAFGLNLRCGASGHGVSDAHLELGASKESVFQHFELWNWQSIYWDSTMICNDGFTDSNPPKWINHDKSPSRTSTSHIGDMVGHSGIYQYEMSVYLKTGKSSPIHSRILRKLGWSPLSFEHRIFRSKFRRFLATNFDLPMLFPESWQVFRRVYEVAYGCDPQLPKFMTSIFLLVLSREWMGMGEWDYHAWLLWIIPSFPTKHQKVFGGFPRLCRETQVPSVRPGGDAIGATGGSSLHCIVHLKPFSFLAPGKQSPRP